MEKSENKTEILRVRISKSDKEKLRAYSKSNFVGMSQTVRQLIQTL